MGDWMEQLAAHFRRMRARYPDEPLMIVFDIDGTIVDSRRLIAHLLLSFDRAHQSSHFQGLKAEDVQVHASRLDELLRSRGLADETRERVLRWFSERYWTALADVDATACMAGVLDVIRWFQLQPNTSVGLNTGRPEFLREETLASLNRLGLESQVRFEDKLLFMNESDWYTAGETWPEAVQESKAAGLQSFQRAGYRVFAAFDNEPANIEAMRGAGSDEVLFLHAETLFASSFRGEASASGQDYDLTRLAGGQPLPRAIELVWRSVNDAAGLRGFLASELRWAECDVRRDPLGRLVLREAPFELRPWEEDERFVFLADVLAEVSAAGRGIKLDLQELGAGLDEVIAAIQDSGIPQSRLWINAAIEDVREDGVLRLADAFPEAILQCPVDFLIPLALAAPARARRLLKMLESWGVTRVSLRWDSRRIRVMARFLEGCGAELNIYDVPELESFLQAALLLPRSLTTRFAPEIACSSTANPEKA